MIERREQAEI